MNETSRAAATAIVVLGCRVLPTHVPSPTLARRLDHAVALWHAVGADYLILCGGRAWNGISEAEVMRQRALGAGVPAERILCELRSTNTRENAQFCREILRTRHIGSSTLVTSDWHMARAMLAFRRVGVSPVPSPALTPRARGLDLKLLETREKLRRAIDRFVMIFEARR